MLGAIRKNQNKINIILFILRFALMFEINKFRKVFSTFEKISGPIMNYSLHICGYEAG